MQARMLFIFITILIDAIGIGIVIPVLPDIMRRFTSNEALVSEFFGYFISLYAFMQLMASPLLGALSDRFGRRPLLLVSLCVAGLDYLVMAYAPTLFILFLGRIFSGLTGANFTVAMAYIADISNDENRSKNYGLMGAAFGLGFVIGPAMGGLLGEYGAHYPFIMAAILCFFNFLFGLFILPESLIKEKRRKVELKRTNPLYSMKHILKAKHLLLLMLVHFLFQLAGQTHPSIWTLYTEARFNWSATEVGLSLALVGVLSAIVQGGLTGVVVAKIGEPRAVKWGAVGYGISFALYGLADKGWMMYAILILSSTFWVAAPALQSIITKNTPSHEQGELQGSLVSLTSLAAIITPLVVTKLFSYFSSLKAPLFLPGAPYYFAALMCFLSYIVIKKERSLKE